MKKVFLVFLFFSAGLAHAEPFVVDRIEASIFTDAGTVIVTQSDIARPTLDGQFRTRDDVILERMMQQEAKKFKIEVDDNAINKYLDSIQKEHGLSSDDLKEMFAQAGYTYEEGREQIGTMFAVNTLTDFKIKARLIVPEKEARAYYDANPVIIEARARIKHGFIPFDESMERDAQKAEIMQSIKDGKKIAAVQWGQPFWVSQGDIAQDKQYIFDAEPNTITEPREVTDGFEVYKVFEQEAERLVPFEERYKEIAELLRKPRFEKILADFKKELFDASSIIYF